MLLRFLFTIAVPAKWAGVRREVGTGHALLGAIAAREVVERQTWLPGRTFGSAFGSSQPGSGKRVEALPNGGGEAEVVALGLDFAEDSAALRGAEHVEQGSLRHGSPTKFSAPVVAQDAEIGPSPSQLIKGLDEAPNWSTPVEGLDVLSQGFRAGSEL